MDINPAAHLTRLDRPPRPIIEGLTAYDEVDLEALGDADLMVFITYDNIAEGDEVEFNWMGADEDGNAVEFTGVVILDNANFDPGNNRARVALSNQYIVAAINGYAFVFFKPKSPALEESLRAFCFVGLRPNRLEHMPVAQAPDSHNLFIDPDLQGSAGVTFLVPAYQAMQAGDSVKLTCVGYASDGSEDDAWSRSEDVTAEQVGQVLRWQVPLTQFDFIKGGHVDIHYEIQFADLTTALSAPTQPFRIDRVPADPPLLPALEIDGYSSGPLDPVLFPDGLVLRVPANPEFMVSDWVLLHFNDDVGVQQLRIDLSCLESDVVAFNFPVDKLKGLDRITLGYQVARENFARSAVVREIELVVRREDAPLNVHYAEAEAGEEQFNAVLPADKAVGGAYIDLSEVTLIGEESLEVYWEGRSKAGCRTFHFTEVPAEPLHIPPEAVAANMEMGDTSEKRFPVYYKILPVGHESQKLHLRIYPLAMDKYPTLQCRPRRGNDLHLSDIVGTHAELTLASWPFMSEGQYLVIVLSGVAGGAPQFHTLRDSAVTEAEAKAGVVVAQLCKTVLQKLDNNSPLEFNVSIDFEGKEFEGNFTKFPPLSLMLRK